MRFGCCVGLDELPIVEDAGYDYAELAAAAVLHAEEPESAFAPTRAAVRAVGLPIEAFNVFLPGHLKITGPSVEDQRVERYVATALRRAAELGATVQVVGSAGARNVPDGYPRDQAWAQLVGFLRMAGPHAQRAGMALAIEPLNRGESNIINSVAEGIRLVNEVGHPAVRVLSDLYHVTLEDEPFDDTAAAGQNLIHVHVADTGRLYPGSGQYDYPGYIAALRSAGYNARISVECGWGDFAAEAPRALRFLRDSWAS